MAGASTNVCIRCAAIYISWRNTEAQIFEKGQWALSLALALSLSFFGGGSFNVRQNDQCFLLHPNKQMVVCVCVCVCHLSSISHQTKASTIYIHFLLLPSK